MKGRFRGGVEGNRALTVAVGIVLFVLCGVEILTLVALRPLLSVHVFVGMLLVPVVGLKLGAVMWRFARYYLHAAAYRLAGPPPLLLRVLGPFVVLTTLGLLGSGVALIAFGRGTPYVLTAHKASFVLWAGAISIHVLGHLGRVWDVAGAWLQRRRLPGGRARVVALAASVLAGLVLATATLPLASQWHHHNDREHKGDR